ncbi:MAG TPA: hypothetical protein GXX43_03925 [Tepidanaerobacter syntrophicus]|uniref:hypothetical protein n=1 Tax=Tepidanaerobacter syntrophicus TaxID=224999 RepID=UPI001769D049|nr:hypothetical protein [Tepidanaerobacter syntrophicus]HHV82796.1 hypothetical protein [Tepidanaerobacter syntrophicus]
MLPKDNFYNLILEHRLPLNRKDKSVKEFLKSYYSRYIKEYKNALKRTEDCALREECYKLLNDKTTTLEELCSDILKVFDYYDSADMLGLYNHFDEMMEKISALLVTRNIGTVGHETYKNYYRIRAGEEHFNRIDLFHIPLNKREFIKSYRYSIPGYPCLYLSSGVEMCWFECGMPKEFSYAGFFLESSDNNKVNIIDFTIEPVDLVSSVSIHYINHPEKAELIDEFLAKYIILFPLRVACSLEVINRDVPFIEEYIFPQQLLLWVRSNNIYDGIAYRTCSSIEHAREWNYINLVMPAKTIVDGYCRHLNRLFTVTEPVKVEISNIIRNRDGKLRTLEKTLMIFETEYYNGHSMYPCREIISLSKTFLNLCSMLKSNNYSNANAIYQTLDTLNLMSNILCDNKETIKSKALAKAKELDYRLDEDILIKRFDEMIWSFEETIKPIIFEFWNFAIRIRTDFPCNYNSREHVLQ